MAGKWTPQDGDQIVLNFKTVWIASDGDLVELKFGNESSSNPPVDCEWADVPGDQVVLTVPSITWADVPGDQIIIQLPNCGGGGEIVDLEPGDFYHGETLEGRLDETYRAEFFYGESFEVDLTTTTVARFEVELYHGESLVPNLGVDWRLVATAYHGENLNNVNLIIRPAVLMTATAYHGESFRDTSFRPEYVGFPSTFYYGESLIGVITERGPITLTSVAYHGEALTVTNLNTQIQLDGTFHHGEALTANLVVPGLYTELAATVYYGETVSAVLNSGGSTLNGFVYHGEALTATLETKPSIALGIVHMYHGDNLWCTMQSSEAFKLGPYRYGEALTAVLDEQPNEEFFGGESLTAYLSTEDIFRPRPFYHGENVGYIELIMPPRAAMSASAYEGIGGTTPPGDNELTVMYHARMSAVFRESVWMWGSVDGYFLNTGTLDFTNSGWDLDLVVHRPGVFDLDLKNGDRATDRYTKEAICLTADLSTMPRFRATAYHGESAYTVDLDIYLDNHGIIEFYAGEVVLSRSMVADIHIPLCYGNFIPDADNLYIDFAGFEVSDCPSHSAYAGEYLTAELETTSGVGATFWYGTVIPREITLIGGATIFAIEFKCSQDLAADLTHETTWIHGIHPYKYGESLRADLTVSQFYTNFEGIQNFYEGTTIDHRITLITDERRRTVRHLESGCLPNEYVPMTESGDLDWSQYNPVPIELDPYTHEIKAICE